MSKPKYSALMTLTFLLLTSLLLLTASPAQQDGDPCESLKRQQQEVESRLRDWPSLAHYREADTQLGPAVKGESRIVFLGDSITDNWNLSDSFAGKPYVNRGISGQTTPQILLRFRQDVIALKPKAVVILAGTNDIAENTGPITLEAIEDNLISMVELAQRNGIRVFLCSVLPAARYPWRPEIQPIEKIQSLNRWMREYASQAGVEFLDYYSAMVDQKSGLKEELGTDGVHPNRAGYAVMSQLASKKIAEVVSRK
jgi:lysophospholipase L1-like esterase